MSNEHAPERRKSIRIDKHFILKYYDLANPDVIYSATQLKNISIGGICFTTATAFAIGTALAVDIKTPMLAEITHLEGTILASEEKLKNIIYETRLQFKNLTDQDIKMLKATIEYFEKESTYNE